MWIFKILWSSKGENYCLSNRIKMCLLSDPKCFFDHFCFIVPISLERTRSKMKYEPYTQLSFWKFAYFFKKIKFVYYFILVPFQRKNGRTIDLSITSVVWHSYLRLLLFLLSSGIHKNIFTFSNIKNLFKIIIF